MEQKLLPNKIKYRRSDDKPKFKSCPIGSHIVTETIFDIDEKTGDVIKTKGKSVDIYKSIQAYARTCGVRFLLSQVATGKIDIRDLSKDYEGIDTTLLPSDIHSAHKIGVDLVNSYDNDKILQSIYKNKEDFKKALEKGEDISKKVNDFVIDTKNKYTDFFYKRYANKIANKDKNEVSKDIQKENK